MKRLFASFMSMAFAMLYPVVVSQAQDCTAYFPMEKGKTFEITNYNAKGKVQSTATHEVIDRREEAGSTMVDVSSEVDTGKKEPVTLEYSVECRDGEFRINTFRGMSEEQLSAMEGQVTVDGDYLALPANLEPGQTLNDATMYIRYGSEGGGAPGLMNFKFDITNRKVEALEDVSTPAGDFSAYKITYDVKTKMIVSVETSIAEWHCEGVGVVKSETYNKKGKLQGYSLLTKLN